jgi:hypothetical protein
MKKFKQFLESTAETNRMDAAEIKRQKKHLLDKAKEYQDQADREKMQGSQGGAAEAKGKAFVSAANNLKEEDDISEAMRSGFDYVRAAKAREQMKKRGFEPGDRPYTWKKTSEPVKNEPVKNEPMKKEEVELDEASPAWQRKEGKSASGGLNRKGIASYRRANPGSKLSMAVTTKPSKLKKGSKAAKRRLSFCRRMSGMKAKLTSAKTARDPNSRINKSLRKWNC